MMEIFGCIFGGQFEHPVDYRPRTAPVQADPDRQHDSRDTAQVGGSLSWQGSPAGSHVCEEFPDRPFKLPRLRHIAGSELPLKYRVFSQECETFC
jgi:hypothetical protein